MREIKFRGKQIDNGEWVEGFYWAEEARNTNKHHIYTFEKKGNTNLIRITGNFEVDPATVGQYSELCDIRNQEIYESDICRLSYTGMDGKKRSHTWVVKYENGMYWLRHIGELKHYDSALLITFREIEVIGNIHDNPELLEVGHEL